MVTELITLICGAEPLLNGRRSLSTLEVALPPFLAVPVVTVVCILMGPSLQPAGLRLAPYSRTSLDDGKSYGLRLNFAQLGESFEL